MLCVKSLEQQKKPRIYTLISTEWHQDLCCRGAFEAEVTDSLSLGYIVSYHLMCGKHYCLSEEEMTWNS